MADRDVEVDILAHDKTGKATRSATRNFERMRERVAKSTDQVNKATKSGNGLAKTMVTVARTVGRAVSTMAALASVSGPAAIGLLATAKAAAATGKALAALAPLAAFLPSLIGSVQLLTGTVKLAAPAMADAMRPIARQFFDAEGNAARLTRRIRELATQGVRPLAEQFVRVNMPAIGASMEQIAGVIGRIVVSTGRWVNSLEGQKLIADTAFATASAFTMLGPKVTAAAIAVGRLANRAGSKGITGFADLIGRILDRFTAWANSTSVQDINDALRDLSGYGGRLKSLFAVVRDIGQWLGENEAKVRSFASALAVLGIAIGALSGNPFAVIIAGISLLITNWERAKTLFSGAAGWWRETWTRITNDPAVLLFVDAVRRHIARMLPVVRDLFAQLQAEVLPKLIQLKNVVMRDLLPAITAFINAASPIVVWFATKFGPVIVTVVGHVVTVITNALRIISGIINVFAALLSGDWRRLWLGIRQIVTGVWGNIKAAVSAGWRATIALIRAGASAAAALFTAWKERVTGAFRSAGSWLAGVGGRIVDGLVAGIRGAAGRVSAAVSGLIGRAKSAVPGVLRGALGFAEGASWRPAQVAAQFAGAGFGYGGPGRARTGGPTPVSVSNTVLLDGQPFYAMTTRTVVDSERRQAWRAHVGRR